MGTTQADHPWEQPENDELEEDLIVRRKNLNRTQLSSTIDGGFSSNEGGSVGATNGGDQEQDDEEEEEVKDFSQQNGVKVNEDETEKEKQQKSEYLVYYDADKGTGLHLKSSKEEANGVDSTFDGNIPMKDNIHSQDNGNGMHFITNQNGEHGKDNKLSDSSLQPSEISFEGVQKPEINEEIEVITDVENEFDVETVLKKQETHDLFCPNCNSCITKRVILRKRKRNIPVPGELAMRNKPATSNPNPNPNPSQVNFVSDDSQPLLSNEYDHDKDTDVFRCLSCFSIFMPTGNGFKFFRMFKNKNNQENTQSSQKEVNVKKSWFSNIFASDKVEESNSQGSSRPQANSRTTNDKMVLEKDEVESTQSVGQQQEYPNPIGHGINGKLDVESVTSHVNGNNKAPSYAQVLNSNKPPISEESKNVVRGTNGLLTPEANPSPTTIVNIDLEKDQVQLITQQQYPNPLEYKVRERLDSDNLSPSVNGDNNALSTAQESDAIKQTIAQGSDTESNRRSTADTQLTEDTADHLLTSYHTEFNDKSDYPGMFIVKPPLNNIEAEQEDIISPQHHDGLTLHAPPNIGSLIIDNSQMNQMLDVTIQTNTPGPDLEIGSRAVEQGCGVAATGGRSLDIVKSIVYGGLLETIASLSVVASAVGAGATTLNVLALGLANIFGGLLVISHDLWDLKNEGRGSSEEDRYQQLLGRRMDFPLHMFVSLLSYLVFGFLPPVVYGFSFRESNDMNFKLLMVAAASTVCIMILAAGKAYVQSRRKSYFKTICYYVMFGFAVSGVSYLFGELIMKLLEKIDLFPSGPVVNSGDLGAAALVATY